MLKFGRVRFKAASPLLDVECREASRRKDLGTEKRLTSEWAGPGIRANGRNLGEKLDTALAREFFR